ncbi:Glycosylphosphatidylinositol (GPI) anchor assembly protein [Mucor velutinosus]|uniref:Glycosylphosphatidylinositol (GPI) anchor assembly protein n=1 Tax=Mucor velutinosus TaxID=708070 RepID=A0AAN7DH58_9FUNG|nr:Glycosylphosphatidylinositol (GPI) anchor assembly protein [Mucor velutinosus]
MATVGFNALWLLCVILLLIAFFLAIRRRRLAARAEDRNNQLNATTFIRHTGQEVRIHMPSHLHPCNMPAAATNNSTANAPYTPIHTDGIQPPPPTFDPHEDQPPPSYQDFNKDVRIQSSSNSNNNTNPP